MTDYISTAFARIESEMRDSIARMNLRRALKPWLNRKREDDDVVVARMKRRKAANRKKVA